MSDFMQGDLFGILNDDHEVVVVDSLVKMIEQGHEAPKTVCTSEFSTHPDLRVSTIFMGINLRLTGKAAWFETMVFLNDKAMTQFTRRYETYVEALEGHMEIADLAVAAVEATDEPAT